MNIKEGSKRILIVLSVAWLLFCIFCVVYLIIDASYQYLIEHLVEALLLILAFTFGPIILAWLAFWALNRIIPWVWEGFKR